jgi:hypothetical protein
LADLALRIDVCVIRATLRPEFRTASKVLRRLHDRGGAAPAPFEERPRAWVMIDLEPATCAVDPTDPVAAGRYLRRRLPPAFQNARCAVQLSSGAGIKPGLRAHLWFLLDRPLLRTELDRLLGGVDGLDPSTFRPVQIHYTANPLFDGVDDPCDRGRLAVLPGVPVVEVGDLPEPRPRPRPCQSTTVRPRERGEAYAQACLSRLAVAPEGDRHRTCVQVACRLLALAKAGQIDPERVASMIKGVASPWCEDDRGLAEIDRILEWAWTTVQPEGLPDGR